MKLRIERVVEPSPLVLVTCIEQVLRQSSGLWTRVTVALVLCIAYCFHLFVTSPVDLALRILICRQAPEVLARAIFRTSLSKRSFESLKAEYYFWQRGWVERLSCDQVSRHASVWFLSIHKTSVDSKRQIHWSTSFCVFDCPFWSQVHLLQI